MKQQIKWTMMASAMVLALMIAVLAAPQAQAAPRATCTTTSIATWSTATWSCGSPAAGDNVQILSGGNITMNATKTVANLTIDSGATLDASASNYTLNIAGNWSNSGTFTQRNGTVTFNGTGAQTINNINTFNTLIINSGSTTHLGANQTIASDVYISGTLNMNSNALSRSVYGGNVSLASNATLLIGSSYPSQFATFTFDPTSTTVYSGTTQTVLHGTYGNLSLSGGTKTMLNPITVAGDLTIASGATFDASASNYALSVAGDFTNSGTFNARSGTVTFNGTSTISGNDSRFNTLIVNSGKTVNLAASQTITSGLYISGTLNQNSYVADRPSGGGTLSVANGATLLIGANPPKNYSTKTFGATSTTVYSGTVNQDVLGTTYGNLTLSGGYTKTLWSFATSVAGNLTIGSGTTLDVSASNYALNVAGDFTNNGAFTPQGGTVTFNGAGAQTLTGATTFWTLTISNTVASPSDSTAVSTTSAITVNNYMNVTDGQFSPATGSSLGGVIISANGILKPAASANINVLYSWSNGGMFTHNSGTVTFNRAGAETLTGNTTFNNLTINSGTTVNAGSTTQTINGNWSNSGTFNAQTGTVTFAGAGAQTINGNNSRFNTLVINSGSTTHLGATQTITSDLYIIGTLNLNTYTADRSSGGGTLSLASGASLLIGGTNTVPGNYGTRTFAVDSTTVYSGTAQNVRDNTYLTHGNVILAGGTKTLTGATDIAGNLTINSGATLDVSTSNYALNVAGNWSNNGTFTPQGGTVTFNGSTAQGITGATTFYNLTTNNSAGITANNNITVTRTITLSSDLAANGTNAIILGSAATVTGTKDITGIARRVSPAASTTLQFNNRYTTFYFTSTVPSQMDSLLSKSAPSILTTAVSRHYTLTPTGSVSATMQLAYLATEKGSVNEANAKLWRFDTGLGRWVLQGGTVNTTDATWHYVTLGGVSQFSDWAITNDGSGNPTAVTLSSFQANAPGFDLGAWLRKFLGR